MVAARYTARSGARHTSLEPFESKSGKLQIFTYVSSPADTTCARIAAITTLLASRRRRRRARTHQRLMGSDVDCVDAPAVRGDLHHELRRSRAENPKVTRRVARSDDILAYPDGCARVPGAQNRRFALVSARARAPETMNADAPRGRKGAGLRVRTFRVPHANVPALVGTDEMFVGRGQRRHRRVVPIQRASQLGRAVRLELENEHLAVRAACARRRESRRVHKMTGDRPNPRAARAAPMQIS